MSLMWSINMIKVQPNYLPLRQYQQIEDYCYAADYYYGERDNPHTQPTGLVHNLSLNSHIVKYFPTKGLFRAYINYFSAGEQPHFHVDHGRLTSLYYINEEGYNLNEGGCTEIHTHEGHLTSVLPFRNTLVTFDAVLPHRATSFNTLPRFTLALKYE